MPDLLTWHGKFDTCDVNALKFRAREGDMPCALEINSNGRFKREHVRIMSQVSVRRQVKNYMH